MHVRNCVKVVHACVHEHPLLPVRLYDVAWHDLATHDHHLNTSFGTISIGPYLANKSSRDLRVSQHTERETTAPRSG